LLIVQKYGGSSVSTSERIMNVANRIVNTAKEGNQVVVVLSAQGDTTDILIEKAKEITARPSNRELDVLLSTGEQQSVALMAMAIHTLGYAAKSLLAFQIGLNSNSLHSNARIKNINTDRIKTELENNQIVIVAGFQGINKKGDITTLGRGGSDTSAVALATVLNADKCEIYTDVDGIYSADPRLVKNAKKLNEICYDEMLELASLGAQVLHNRSIELAKKYNVQVIVRSSMTEAEGTVVKEGSKMEKMFVSGLAVDKNISRISVVGIPDEPGKAFQMFSLLAKNKISVDIILQSIGRSETKDITFTISETDLDAALDVLKDNEEMLGYKYLNHAENVAKLSVVGAGMATNSGVAALMFEALYDAGVNIHMISTSEIKISVLIDETDMELAANYVHDKFLTQNINL